MWSSFRLLLSLLLLTLVPASAQWNGCAPGFCNPPATAAAPKTLTWTKTGSYQNVSGAGLGQYQYVTESIGTATPDRVVVCLLPVAKAVEATQGYVQGISINGTALNHTVRQSTAKHDTEIWWGDPGLITGSGSSTNNVTITLTAGYTDGLAIICGTITGSTTTNSNSSQIATPPAYNSSSNTNSGAVTVATGGVSLFVSISDSGSTTSAWTGGGTNGNQTDGLNFTGNGSGFSGSISYGNASGTVTETVTGSSGYSGWISASFVP